MKNERLAPVVADPALNNRRTRLVRADPSSEILHIIVGIGVDIPHVADVGSIAAAGTAELVVVDPAGGAARAVGGLEVEGLGEKGLEHWNACGYDSDILLQTVFETCQLPSLF